MDEKEAGDPSSIERQPTVYRLRVLHSSATEYCACAGNLQVASNDLVVVETRYGNDLARVQGTTSSCCELAQKGLRMIVRKATPSDLAKHEEHKEKEQRAYAICREKIAEHGLDMKLVCAHYLLDETKILFFFIAESRVDFRELVRDLVAVFKTRIELRQIGVRDEARLHGGLGMCGRSFCCHSVSDRLDPVSIRMAKEQDLTLNSMKISGPCGRLLCCLAYEHELYRDARKNVPAVGTRVAHDEEMFSVSNVNIVSGKVQMTGESGRVLEIDLERLSREDGNGGWKIG